MIYLVTEYASGGEIFGKCLVCLIQPKYTWSTPVNKIAAGPLAYFVADALWSLWKFPLLRNCCGSKMGELWGTWIKGKEERRIPRGLVITKFAEREDLGKGTVRAGWWPLVQVSCQRS